MARRVRETYLEDAAAVLARLTDRLDGLRAFTERTPSAQRFALERALDELRGLRNRTEAKLEDVRRSSEDAWQLIKVHSDNALAQFKGGLDRVETQMQRSAA